MTASPTTSVRERTRIPDAVKAVGDAMAAAFLCATGVEYHTSGCPAGKSHNAWFSANTDHDFYTILCAFHFLEAAAEDLGLSDEQTRYLRYLGNRVSTFRRRQLPNRRAGVIDFGNKLQEAKRREFNRRQLEE